MRDDSVDVARMTEQVELEVCPPDVDDDEVSWALAWRPVVRSPFPDFTDVLTLSGRGDRETSIRLEGTYEPPFGPSCRAPRRRRHPVHGHRARDRSRARFSLAVGLGLLAGNLFAVIGHGATDGPLNVLWAAIALGSGFALWRFLGHLGRRPVGRAQ